MLNTIKKYKIEELEKQINDYNEVEQKIISLKKMIDFLEEEVKKIENYSFIQKNITKKNEYQLLLNKQKDLINSKSSLDDLIKKYNKNDIYLFNDQLEKIKNSRTIKELGLTFDDAVRFLKNCNEETYLDESDKAIVQNDSEFSNKNDYILVHKTSYNPENGFVKSYAEKKVTINNVVQMTNGNFTSSYAEPRNTIHFCLNGEVSSHSLGNFDGRKYAVLIPLSNIEDNNIKSFSPEDTYLEGKVSTKGGYILCPISEVKKIQNDNPECLVVGYKGDSVDGFANSFLSMIGYKHRHIGAHYWHPFENESKNFEIDRAHELAFEKNQKYPKVSHFDSSYSDSETLKRKYNKFIAFLEGFNNYINKYGMVDVDAFLREFKRKIEKCDDISFNNLSIVGLIESTTGQKTGDKYYVTPSAEGDNKMHFHESVERANARRLNVDLARRFDILLDDRLLDLLCAGFDYNDEKQMNEFVSKVNDELLNEIMKNKTNDMSNKKIIDEYVLKLLMKKILNKSNSFNIGR